MIKACNKNCICQKCAQEMYKPGKAFINILIGSASGLPVQVGTIQIDTDPLLVEDWMLNKVSQDAAKALTKYVLESNAGKVVN